MLPEMGNGKRNGKRERYEKRCSEVSHIRNEEREKYHIKSLQIIFQFPTSITVMTLQILRVLRELHSSHKTTPTNS